MLFCRSGWDGLLSTSGGIRTFGVNRLAQIAEPGLRVRASGVMGEFIEDHNPLGTLFSGAPNPNPKL